MKLVIAEKPSQARDLRTFFEKYEGESFANSKTHYTGKDVTVTWCIGHLVELAPPEDYDFERSLDNLPLIPENWIYKVKEDTKKQFFKVKELIESADRLIAATDADREGELIYRLVVFKSGGLKKPQERMWIHSLKPEGLKKAWDQRRPAKEFQNLGFAGIIRDKADWLIGMNCSIGYSLGTGVRGISVGRVQTPTLRMIVDQDRKVENWKDKYYNVLNAQAFGLRFVYENPQEKGKPFKSEDPAPLKEIASKVQGATATISSVQKEEKKQSPPKPHFLSSLSQEANSKHGFSAKDTLSFAQKLYEKKLVTYPRTDSPYLTEDMKGDCLEVLAKFATQEQKKCLHDHGDLPFFNDKKVGSHFALIPTGDDPKELPEKEQKVFDLIKDRFILAFGLPHKYEETYLEMEAEGHRFFSRVKATLEKGFKGLSSSAPKEEEEEEFQETDRTLQEGESGSIEKVNVEQKKVTPPKHFTGSTVLNAMKTAGKHVDDKELQVAMKETKGLGTEATRGAIIENLEKKGFIQSKGKKLISTTKGRELIDLVDEKVKSPEMTGEWESRLAKIAEGEQDFREFQKELEDYLRELSKTFDGKGSKNFAEKLEKSKPACPCGKARLDIGPGAVKCTKEDCDLIIWRKVAQKKLSDKQVQELVTNGRTSNIKGFKNKQGKTFEAALVLDKSTGNLNFDFPKKKQQSQGKSRSGPKRKTS